MPGKKMARIRPSTARRANAPETVRASRRSFRKAGQVQILTSGREPSGESQTKSLRHDRS
jgi:hypothetical protein